MAREINITKVKPTSLKQQREYYKQQIADVDSKVAEIKADIHAVSTNAYARRSLSDPDGYITQQKDRLAAFRRRRDAYTRQLSRINKTIKNVNRETSGRQVE